MELELGDDLKFLRNGVEELVQYDKHCCVFLERMRQSSSFDIVQKFKSFTNEFVGTHHSSAEQCSEAIHTFIEDMFVSLSEHPLWREEGHIGWDSATEAAERYLLTKLFKVTYVLPCTTDIADDEKFYHRVRTLQFLKPTHFDILERPLNRVVTEMAAQELYKADSANMKSPKEKLTCILNCITILSNFLKHCGDLQGTGADDLLPYLIVTIIFLSPKHMHSNIRFISRFRRQSKMESEAAYYFTQMESAVLFIMDADHRNLSITELDFRQGIEHCQELIKSSQDVSQFVASSDSALLQRHPSLLVSPGLANPSPILARRATVMKEWDNLERTRALSHLEGSRTGTDVPPPSAPMPAELPGPSPACREPASSVGGGDRNGNGTEAGGDGNLKGKEGEVMAKLLSASFEELTVSDLKLLHSTYKTLATSQLQAS